MKSSSARAPSERITRSTIAAIPNGEEARRITGGRGVDVVVEVGGDGTLVVRSPPYAPVARLPLLAASAAGQLRSNSAGPDASRAPDGYFRRQPRDVRGSESVRHRRKDWPTIDRVFSFDRAREAYAYLESANHFGKVVIKVGD